MRYRGAGVTMRALLLLVAVGLSLGSATSYQGSYRETRLSEHRWMVRVGVNGYTDTATATEYAYRRAAELCPQGFTPIDSTRDRHIGAGLEYDPQTRGATPVDGGRLCC
jgi:hypothetical protein